MRHLSGVSGDVWRLRVGKYRAIIEKDSAGAPLYIHHVRLRDKAYRK